MNIKGLKTKTKKELIKELEESRKKIEDLRFGVVTKKVKNYKEIKGTRKKIAQILTILKEQQGNLSNHKGEN